MKELLNFCADQTEGFYEFKGTTRGTCSAEYQFSFGNRVNKCFSIWKIQFSSQPFFFFFATSSHFSVACEEMADMQIGSHVTFKMQIRGKTAGQWKPDKKFTEVVVSLIVHVWGKCYCSSPVSLTI